MFVAWKEVGDNPCTLSVCQGDERFLQDTAHRDQKVGSESQSGDGPIRLVAIRSRKVLTPIIMKPETVAIVSNNIPIVNYSE